MADVLHHQHALYFCSLLHCHVSGSIITESMDDWCFHHLIACLVFWLRGVRWVYFFWWNVFAWVSHIHWQQIPSLPTVLGFLFPDLHTWWSACWCDVCFFLQEEFCYPVECLALTVEEVMHIRQVLVKAELEKFQQYKDIYTALKKGKVDATSRVFMIIFLRHRFKCNRWCVPSSPHLLLSSPALLFMSDQEVLSLYLVLHLPVLQKVNWITIIRTTQLKGAQFYTSKSVYKSWRRTAAHVGEKKLYKAFCSVRGSCVKSLNVRKKWAYQTSCSDSKLHYPLLAEHSQIFDCLRLSCIVGN